MSESDNVLCSVRTGELGHEVYADNSPSCARSHLGHTGQKSVKISSVSPHTMSESHTVSETYQFT